MSKREITAETPVDASDPRTMECCWCDLPGVEVLHSPAANGCPAIYEPACQNHLHYITN